MEEKKKETKQEREKMLCNAFCSFVPMLTNLHVGPHLCVYVCEGSVHDRSTPLNEATFAGSSN